MFVGVRTAWLVSFAYIGNVLQAFFRYIYQYCVFPTPLATVLVAVVR